MAAGTGPRMVDDDASARRVGSGGAAVGGKAMSWGQAAAYRRGSRFVCRYRREARDVAATQINRETRG